MRSAVVRTLWGLAGALLVVLLVKFFFADVYRVDSGSMRPTIFGGSDPRGGDPLDEHVLVRYGGAADLARFDLVVIARPGSDAPMVKRVAGMPGERVQITDGDLMIDGARIPPEALRPAPIAIFDDRFLDVADYFHFDSGPEGPWKREEVRETAETEWLLDSTAIAPLADAGLMLFHKDLRDGYIDFARERIAGAYQVNDGVVECEVMLEEKRGLLRLRLVEEGDTFEALVSVHDDGRVFAVITLRNARTMQADETRVQSLADAEIELAAGAWHRLRFSNVDNHLTFAIDGAAVLEHSYDKNEPHSARTAEGEKSVGSRVALGGEGCRARFRRIRVLRDHYYLPLGEHGLERPVELGPDEFFLLGDNSFDSSDSRFFGPVERDRILGRPLWVVWPPGRIRRLGGGLVPASGPAR